MSSWSEVMVAAPALASTIKARFDAYGLGLLATIRSDGFPRISGIEPLFAEELWLGMMPNSRKAADLKRDPRLCLHSATSDKNVTAGDAKLFGRGVEVEDQKVLRRFQADFAAHSGSEPPPGPMHLFRVEVKEISFLSPNVDHLVIESWRQGGKVRRVERR